MENEKSWYLSKTVWGGLIAVAAGIAGAFGLTIAPEDQAAIADAIVVVASVGGGLLAVFGRIKASKAVN